jgi:hypothetical protein
MGRGRRSGTEISQRHEQRGLAEGPNDETPAPTGDEIYLTSYLRIVSTYDFPLFNSSSDVRNASIHCIILLAVDNASRCARITPFQTED